MWVVHPVSAKNLQIVLLGTNCGLLDTTIGGGGCWKYILDFFSLKPKTENRNSKSVWQMHKTIVLIVSVI